MSPEDIERLAEPLSRLNEAEAATARAYKVCGCGAEYTEGQWAQLLPVRADEWRWTQFDFEEWRECAYCHATLAILRRNGSPRPPDTMPFKSVSDAYHCCGACMRTIRPGRIYVERLERRNGMRAIGRWAFCSTECEAW
jgi:hypothetical protein